MHDPKGIEQSLQARLASLVEQFSYHAVHWQVEVLPGHVFLRITGPADYLAVAISQILTELVLLKLHCQVNRRQLYGWVMQTVQCN